MTFVLTKNSSSIQACWRHSLVDGCRHGKGWKPLILPLIVICTHLSRLSCSTRPSLRGPFGLLSLIFSSPLTLQRAHPKNTEHKSPQSLHQPWWPFLTQTLVEREVQPFIQWWAPSRLTRAPKADLDPVMLWNVLWMVLYMRVGEVL